MPTITVEQPKGGVGKTTTTVNLAVELAKAATVIVIEPDPNAPISNWAKQSGVANLTVIQAGKDDSIIDLIEEAERMLCSSSWTRKELPICGRRKRCPCRISL